MFPTEPPANTNGFRALLHNRNFMLLWIGQLLSQLADKVFLVLTIALLENYPLAAGIEDTRRSDLFMAFTLPAILFGSAGGILVDRVPKKPHQIPLVLVVLPVDSAPVKLAAYRNRCNTFVLLF